jgi:hypothetical protein
LESIRVVGGGGWLAAHYAGGTHLPDGSVELVLAYVPNLSNVLVVVVNGRRFYP